MHTPSNKVLPWIVYLCLYCFLVFYLVILWSCQPDESDFTQTPPPCVRSQCSRSKKWVPDCPFICYSLMIVFLSALLFIYSMIIPFNERHKSHRVWLILNPSLHIEPDNHLYMKSSCDRDSAPSPRVSISVSVSGLKFSCRNKPRCALQTSWCRSLSSTGPSTFTWREASPCQWAGNLTLPNSLRLCSTFW